MIADLRYTVAALPPIDLHTMDQVARLRTRKDRKYVVDPATLIRVLQSMRRDIEALEIDGRRWFEYESIYYDTPDLDAYRRAATHRPNRYKVRIRTYVDSDRRVLEVKTKDRRGRTVKHRRRVDPGPGARPLDTGEAAGRNRSWVAGHLDPTAPVDRLAPRVLSRYRRATVVLADDGSRATIDSDWEAIETDGRRVGFAEDLIVETKSPGPPSALDRALWAEGIRPVKISKYATALAALHPELPANRWRPVLRRHFGWDRSPTDGSPATRTAGSETGAIHAVGPPLVPLSTTAG